MLGPPRTPSRDRGRRAVARAPALLTVALAALALLPAAAPAAGSPVLADCNLHLHLTRQYSIAQLQHALQVMPPDLAQYSDCPTVIRQALDSQLAALRHGAGSGDGSAGGAFVPAWLLAAAAVVVAAGGTASLVAWRRQRG